MKASTSDTLFSDVMLAEQNRDGARCGNNNNNGSPGGGPLPWSLEVAFRWIERMSPYETKAGKFMLRRAYETVTLAILVGAIGLLFWVAAFAVLGWHLLLSRL